MPARDPPTPIAGSFTVSADLISGLIDCATQCGIPRTRLVDTINLDGSRSPASGPPARYAGEHILKLWERIVRMSDDPIIGFRMALVAGVKTFGVLGQILPRCATVREAYRQTARYAALASQGAHVSVASTNATLSVSVAMPALGRDDVSRTIMLWALTNLCLTPQRLAGASVRPRAVSCTFLSPQPADVQTLRKHFPFKFASRADEVVFDRHVGEIEIPSADADLKSLLAETMDRHLAMLGPRASFEQGMLTVLRGMLNGNMPTLGILERTVRVIPTNATTEAR